uniref:Cytochrome b561 domain-containing protein n=1 Tax=Chromera velia CCMP2878 TaxID=1169474 RepID=A0A0G4HW78_9ALVE|eukprot:Cvel_8973.t1-p1 / transcript=Cvel_8973.t1 / gene=Cvel_8973 / organism=Chromera_velia_CCMP2878 / gene_product=Cytochrome b561 domain-containing protein 2, putative / transcript_product=Cytochrome b561 domain-containing protein 2, putative / location=Cvel_scaffold506:44194-45045(-) / protein_length=208 / sequence_SO=supercontig / SO=protein_coding / is_pseudo=false
MLTDGARPIIVAVGSFMLVVCAFVVTPLPIIPFSLHPLPMTLFGSLGVLSTALMRFPKTPMMKNPATGAFFSRKEAEKRHAIAQTFALICASTGLMAIYLSKESGNKPHLTTWHSWLGALGAFVYLLAALAGYAGYMGWVKGARRWHRKLNKPAAGAAFVALVSSLWSSFAEGKGAVGNRFGILMGISSIIFVAAFGPKIDNLPGKSA